MSAQAVRRQQALRGIELHSNKVVAECSKLVHWGLDIPREADTVPAKDAQLGKLGGRAGAVLVESCHVVVAADHVDSGVCCLLRVQAFVVTGLAPDSTTEYQVSIDGATVWPIDEEPFSTFPRSVIRTRGPATAHRLRLRAPNSCSMPSRHCL